MDIQALPRLSFTMGISCMLACFVQMRWALLAARKCNYGRWQKHLGGRAQPESRIKRISRFLREQELAWDEVSRCIMTLLALLAPWTLVMDRTNW